MEKFEPKNCELFVDIAHIFLWVLGRNEAILAETYCFAERAIELDPSSADYMIELVFQCLL